MGCLCFWEMVKNTEQVAFEVSFGTAFPYLWQHL